MNREGRYAARLTALVSPDDGNFDILIDGRVVQTGVGFKAPEPGERDLLIGAFPLKEGDHTITFTSTKAGSTGIEMLRLLELPEEANREVKTHNEAHFIRLGIGRAVYAYRLANDDLPLSLEELHAAGLLEDRYLSDENGHSLLSRRAGGWFWVDSTAKDGWHHRWCGLDARR